MADPKLQTNSDLRPIGRLGLDDFERGVLAVLRHFLMTQAEPETQAWHHAFLISTERWGETVGLAVAHALSKYLTAVLRCRGDCLAFQEPFAQAARDYVTEDEEKMIVVLHFMRRDQTSYARDALAALTRGRMDPCVIRSGLSFSKRFAAGLVSNGQCGKRPKLHLVASDRTSTVIG